MAELAGEGPLTHAGLPGSAERRGRDRADKPDYKVKLNVGFCFSNKVQIIEHYHNSSLAWSTAAARRRPRSPPSSSAIDELPAADQGKYQKSESKITWQDIEDCLVLVSNNFSTQTSYENQTKKAITNKFVQEAMTEFLRAQLEVYFIENRFDADEDRRAGAHQQAQPGECRAGPAEHQEQALRQHRPSPTGCRSSWTAAPRTSPAGRSISWRATPLSGSVKQSRDAEYQGIMPIRGKILNCLKADYARIFKSDIIMDLIRVLGCGVEVQGKHAKNVGAFDLGQPPLEQGGHLHRCRRATASRSAPWC